MSGDHLLWWHVHYTSLASVALQHTRPIDVDAISGLAIAPQKAGPPHALPFPAELVSVRCRRVPHIARRRIDHTSPLHHLMAQQYLRDQHRARPQAALSVPQRKRSRWWSPKAIPIWGGGLLSAMAPPLTPRMVIAAETRCGSLAC